MVDYRETIVGLVKQKGPCLPTDVYKELNTSPMFASAMLGEMVSRGILKVTHLKRGSSPYYYLEEEKSRLQEVAHFLNQKDYETYKLLKEKKVLRDTHQVPLVRVSLRTIKDYAEPVSFNFQGQPELL